MSDPFRVIPGIKKSPYEVAAVIIIMPPEYQMQGKYSRTASICCCCTAVLLLLEIPDLRTGAPSGLVSGPRAYYDQFRGFEYHRVHTRAKGLFLAYIFSRGKREMRATFFNENRRVVGDAAPYAR